MKPTFTAAWTAAFVHLRRLAIPLLFIFCQPGWAAPSPEMERGLAWLAAQVQADGSLSGEAASMATDMQARSEAARTQQLLTGQPDARIGTAVLGDPDDSTEYLARKLMLLERLDPRSSDLVNVLLGRQNADGGFGGGLAYGSGLSDTCQAVQALMRQGDPHDPRITAARTYLAGYIEADGGMRGSTEYLRIWHSAIALRAFQSSVDPMAISAANALAAWLLKSQFADGSWQADVLLTAQVMTSLSPMIADTSAKGVAGAFLVARQAADGSWEGDVYLTAVVLQALAGIQSGGSDIGTSASVNGMVVDAASGQPLMATVSVSGAGWSRQSATLANGQFTFADVLSGPITIIVDAAGYLSVTRSIMLSAGQQVHIGAVPLERDVQTAMAVGTVTDGVGGGPLAGASITVSDGQRVTTGPAGTYAVGGIAPGVVTLAAELPGYGRVMGSALVAAGQVVTFSPALYPDGAAVPGTGSYLGTVSDAESGQPLPGVSIHNDGQLVATTGPDGGFAVSLDPGSYAMAMQMSGYTAVTQSFIMSAGAIVDAGNVALSRTLTSSVLHGRVLDSEGTAIAGADVQVLDGPGVRSGLDGAYRLSGLPGTGWTVRVSATGYASQTYAIQVSQPTEVAQDFRLTPVRTHDVELQALGVNPSVAPVNTEVMVASTLVNHGNADFVAVVQLLVADVAGRHVGQGALFDVAGNPVGMVSLLPGQSMEVIARWNTGLFAPGEYGLTFRLVEPGSISRDNPLGTLLVDRRSRLVVTAATHFTGTVTANPPVIRAGLNQAVTISAVLQNDGNVDLPAQTYVLRVVDVKTNQPVHSVIAQGTDTAPSGLLELDFGSYVPSAGGDYRLEVMAADAGQGLLIGKLYVGDAATAGFTVDKPVVPTGTQTVRASIRINGQDAAQGTISDPLVPLIRTAIQKAVTYNDTRARAWTLSNRCQGCHIQTQAMVGGETLRRFTSFNQYDRSVVINNTTTNQMATGDMADGYPTSNYHTTISTLALWAATAYHDLDGISATLKKAADWIVSKQEADGRWTGDYNGTWFDSSITFSALNINSLTKVHRHFSESASSYATYYRTEPYLADFARTSRGFFIITKEGDYLFSDTGGQVTRVKADGTVLEAWIGLNEPRGLVEAKSEDGVVVATGSGLFMLRPGGVKVQLNSTPTDIYTLAYGPDGKIYGAAWSNKIYQLTESGAASLWVSNGPLRNPWNMAFDSEGGLLVVNTIPDASNRDIIRYAPDKSYKIVTSFVQGFNTPGRPLHLLKNGDGWLLSTTNGVYRFDGEWVAERLLYEPVAQIRQASDGSLVAAWFNSQGFKKIVPYASEIATSLMNYESAIDKAANYLHGQTIAVNDTMHLAHQLIGLGEAYRHYRVDNPAKASTYHSKMLAIATSLRANQNTDGGWGRNQGNPSDPLVTAQVGYALDYTDPSPNDTSLRRAISWLLAKQSADGSWTTGLASTRLASTTWVAIWLPVILDRLGGIDTDLTVTFPANVAMSNPDPAPVSTQSDAEGRLRGGR